MKRKNKQKSIIILTILTIILAYILAAWQFNFFPFKKPTSEVINSIDTPTEITKNIDTPQNKILEKNPDHKTPIQNEGEDPNQLSEITGYVSNKTVNSQSQILTIRVTINQFLSEAGTCSLILNNGNETFNDSASTANNPSSSTCQGFDIPLNKLSSGKWSIKIKVKAGDKAGEIDGGEVEI